MLFELVAELVINIYVVFYSQLYFLIKPSLYHNIYGLKFLMADDQCEKATVLIKECKDFYLSFIFNTS